MGVIIPVASGKGGVGKSIITANLGVALASLGKKVVLVDLDLGASNLHTILGIKNTHSGLGSFIHSKDKTIDNIIMDTEIQNLKFIPGDSLIPGTANIDYFTKQKIIKSIYKIPCDYVLLDLGAGSAYNIIDYFLMSTSGIIVTMPEITAILNSYSFLKTTVYRMLYRCFPAKSEERAAITDFISHKIEGTEKNFTVFVNEIMALFPETGAKACMQLQSLYPKVIMNMGKTNHDLDMGVKLREITQKNLGIAIKYIGFIKREDDVSRSIFEREPIFLTRPNAAFSNVILKIATELILDQNNAAPSLYEAHEDLEKAYEESTGEKLQPYDKTFGEIH